MKLKSLRICIRYRDVTYKHRFYCNALTLYVREKLLRHGGTAQWLRVQVLETAHL